MTAVSVSEISLSLKIFIVFFKYNEYLRGINRPPSLCLHFYAALHWPTCKLSLKYIICCVIPRTMVKFYRNLGRFLKLVSLFRMSLHSVFRDTRAKDVQAVL